MSNAALETLAWVLLYSGLLIVGLALFVLRESAGFGWALLVAGIADAAAGVLLIWLRSRRSG